MHLVKKAENVRSCRNIFHAVIATLGLGLFNLVFVLVPFILLVLMLLFVFIMGVLFTIFGPVVFVYSVLQLLGMPSFAIWLSPLAGLFISIGMTSFGLLLIIGDYYLAPVLLSRRDPVPQMEYQRYHRHGAFPHELTET